MTAEEIAAKLTPAQRGWLRDAWYGPNGWRINYRKKASDLGLTYPRSSLLTPLGQQVRSILEGTSHAD